MFNFTFRTVGTGADHIPIYSAQKAMERTAQKVEKALAGTGSEITNNVVGAVFGVVLRGETVANIEVC
jgi:hypothetical protein